jgi:predicted ATPase
MWLDLANECLWCGDQARALRPKTFALLRSLMAHPGQVLPKAALLEALWPETMVSEVVLAVCIRELRQALGDTARAPRFVETVHRRGYRFIGHLPTVPPAAPLPSSPAPLPLLVGRECELAVLHGALATARTGVRQLLFITGEAGRGKTALVEAFLTALEASGPLWIGRGQCLDQYGAGEAYLPVLEALGRLCRGPDGPEVVALLEQQAPTWLVQLPGLVPPAALEAVQRRLAGAPRERMLRELAEALERLTARQPLVLVLEDLHWCDVSTLDVLAMLAGRRDPARLLVLGTYRPPDALQRGHPLHTVHHELQRHGHCAELPLPLLSEAAVATYLARRFPDVRLPAGLARLVQQRTEGHPLFMVIVVEAGVRRGWRTPADGGGTLWVERAAVAGTVPEGLRQMLEQQLERLSPRDQRVLEVGSVAGATFSAAAVAAGLGRAVVEVEDWCTGLARRQQWLEACGEEVWRDGTVAGQYRFRHALYQEVAYQRLPAARRVQLHRRIGEREEAGYGPQGRERAAELAMHFVRGQDAQRAVRYLQYAGENANQRSAYPEARQHLTQGLTLLATLPETLARAQQELDLQVALAPALIATKGFAAPEVEQAYTRARALSQQVGATTQRFPVLWGLWVFYHVRGESQRARELGEQFLSLAHRAQDRALVLQAHHALGPTCLQMGELPRACAHFEYGIALYDPAQHRAQAFVYGGHDPGICCRAQEAVALWLLGYPDQAVQRCQEALTQARELAHPFSLANALEFASYLHQLRREGRQTQAHAEALLMLAREQGFAERAAKAQIARGWALAAQGCGAEGVALIRQGLDAERATGAAKGRAYYLALLAEAAATAGDAEDGLRAVADALEAVQYTGEWHHAAELHRLKGKLRLTQSPEPHAEAEACFQQALAIARRQQAKSWELRAAMSLARLWQRQGKRAEARELLAEIYGWFTEGFDTADLQDARALFKDLSS